MFDIINGKLILLTQYFGDYFWSKSLEFMGWTVVRHTLKIQSSLPQAAIFQMGKLDHDPTWVFPSALAGVWNQLHVGWDVQCHTQRHISMHMLICGDWQLRKPRLRCIAFDRNDLKGSI